MISATRAAGLIALLAVAVPLSMAAGNEPPLADTGGADTGSAGETGSGGETGGADTGSAGGTGVDTAGTGGTGVDGEGDGADAPGISAAELAGESGGCGCTSSRAPPRVFPVWLVVGLLAARRRDGLGAGSRVRSA